RRPPNLLSLYQPVSLPPEWPPWGLVVSATQLSVRLLEAREARQWRSKTAQSHIMILRGRAQVANEIEHVPFPRAATCPASKIPRLPRSRCETVTTVNSRSNTAATLHTKASSSRARLPPARRRAGGAGRLPAGDCGRA